MTTTMTKLDWKAHETRCERACLAAEEIVEGITPPIDPLVIAEQEGRNLLRCRGEDFGSALDGHLRYHRTKRCFILLYNTTYDRGIEAGHHPRTRFSIAHELGHYFLPAHRAYLMGGGEPHRSRSEFATDQIVEREADSFAAGLLAPSELVRPLVNQGEPDLAVIDMIHRAFGVSCVCATLRAVQLSDFWCAAVGVRDGRIRWCARSAPLREAGFYPPEKGAPKSASARTQWDVFKTGGALEGTWAARTGDWFRTYDRTELDTLHVDEHYLPVTAMETLVILLTIPEDDYLADTV